MPQEQADALIELLNAAFENVVTKDDLKHSLDGLEASVKSYADKLSKDDREFLITFTTNMVDQLRADMNARFDGVDKRFENVLEELAESRKENKEILKEMAAIRNSQPKSGMPPSNDATKTAKTPPKSTAKTAKTPPNNAEKTGKPPPKNIAKS